MRPKCTPQQMIKIIRRSLSSTHDSLTPEHNLLLAVIGCAICDLVDARHRDNAKEFFSSLQFDKYCDLIGLQPHSVRGLLIFGGYQIATTN